jgi:hypothetical protein
LYELKERIGNLKRSFFPIKIDHLSSKLSQIFNYFSSNYGGPDYFDKHQDERT